MAARKGGAQRRRAKGQQRRGRPRLAPCSQERGEKRSGDINALGVGHVKLAGGELGVVREVDALVAELAAELVHAVQAADDELLEVQLGRNAHEEVLAEVVVVREEGPRRRAAGQHVHHRRHHLEEAALVEEGAHVVDDGRALDKHRPRRVVVDDQVQVALTVARPGAGAGGGQGE
jgi:hypothetical protein